MFLKKGTNRIVELAILFVALSYFILFLNYRWNAQPEWWKHKPVICSDALGYYDYLPRYFIDGHKEKNQFDPTFNVHYKGDTLNKYYIGTALLQSPFFVTARLYYILKGQQPNGYEGAFQLAVAGGALFYFLISLWFISRILLMQFNLKQHQVALLVLLFAFGSTLMHYVIIYGAFSHVYSFFSIAWFFYHVSRIAKGSFKKSDVLLVLPAFSFIAVIRPVNIIILLLAPVFFQNFSHIQSTFRSLLQLHKKTLVTGIVISILPVFLQCVSWHEQTGDWIVWSYANEGFNFSNPHVFDVLLSYNYGLFIYCPLVFLSCAGFYFLFRKNKWQFGWMALFFIIFFYVISSWWCWYYGEGLGIRAAVDVFLFFILLLAFIISEVASSTIKKYVLFFLFFVCLPVNFIYSYQYYFRIINPNAMNGEKFWYVFLKTGKEYQNCFGGITCIQPYSPKGMDTLMHTIHHFENEPGGILNTAGKEFPYGEKLELTDAICHHEVYWIKVKMKRKNIQPEGGKNLLLDVHAGQNDSSVYYVSVRVKEMPAEKTEEWIESEYTLSFFNRFHCGNTVGVYLYNPLKEEMLIDDMEIYFFGIR